MTSDNPTLIEIFVGTSWEAGFVKSLLENAEIEVYMKDEIRGSSSLLHFSPGIGGVKLMISSYDYETAKNILQDYYKSRGDKE